MRPEQTDHAIGDSCIPTGSAHTEMINGDRHRLRRWIKAQRARIQQRQATTDASRRAGRRPDPSAATDRRLGSSAVHDSDASTTSDVRGKPGRAGAGRRGLRDRIIGLLGVLFYGIWMILFGVGTILMAAILATGANNPASTSLVAVLCAALSVFNGRWLRRPLRRLRGIQRPHTR